MDDYHLLVENSLGLMCIHDLEGRLTFVSPAAAGVADELNSLVTVILGQSELVYGSLDDDPRRRRMLAIVKAARLAAKLASELLAVSSRLMLRLEPLDLSEVVLGLAPHIHALLPPTVELVCTRAPNVWPVSADRAQIEGAILHLVANARDAMPDGGRLEVGVTNLGAKAGPHVAITVRDTGQGMEPEVRAHLFEPFFTTKAGGSRMGLGLPSVHGIVKQHGGVIEVDSTPGGGTVIRMSFPRCADQS